MIEDKYILPAKNKTTRDKLSQELYGPLCRASCKLKLIVQANPFCVDPAHILGVGAYPYMKMVPLNVCFISRPIHSLIDQYIDPRNKKKMSRQQRELLWIDLIGEEKYELLQKLKIKYRNGYNKYL